MGQDIGFSDMNSGSPRGSKAGRCILIWAVIATVTMVALIIALAVVANQQNDNRPQPASITWCTVNDAEQSKCTQMSAAFQSAQFNAIVNCAAGKSTNICIKMVKNNQADVLTIDGGHLVDNRADLKPILAEDYGEGDATYWAVAVVKKSDSTTFLTKPGLQGKISCHTGLGKTAGWNVPMGVLKDKGILTVSSNGCNIQQAVTNLFSQSCAPGAPTSSKLCKKCSTCTCGSDPYCGYTGAFRCLVEGGNVAFIKHTTVFSNTDGSNTDSWAQNLRSADFELLCSDGTRAPVSAYSQCNLGKVPSHAVVVSKQATAAVIDRIVETMYLAQLKFGPHSGETFKLFGGASKDLLFKSSTKLLMPLNFSCNSDTYLGSSYLNSQLSLQCQTTQSTSVTGTCLLPQYQSQAKSALRWCVISDDEMTKCTAVATQARRIQSVLVVSCVRGTSVANCARLISLGAADAITMDSGHIYTMGRDYDLQPVAAEFYGGSAGASYYAVAVIKASDTSTRLTRSALQGKKSCHTGYQRTAGWNVPVGFLIDNQIVSLNSSGCSVAEALSNFFDSSCAPGASAAFPGAVGNKLCQICGGTGANKCDASLDPYSGYAGAIRCLNAGGDIAFVKHTTVLGNDSYQLACPDGSVQPVANYINCYLARVPSHAVMLSSQNSFVYYEKVWNLLNSLQNTAGTFQIFSSSEYNNGKDLMFKDSTHCLLKVETSCTWRDFLGTSYINTVRGTRCLTGNPPTPSSTCTIQSATCN
uniref:serotransferrin-1 n=1 Tax=Ciona intestinalis TaxID=7719 RepID=UPI00005241A3|nr:serotransferrin-1 [Ciona intestinalis]|eukprot:XP_002120780.1 serotransferrin-1 [Ciona intestinalis]